MMHCSKSQESGIFLLLATASDEKLNVNMIRKKFSDPSQIS